MPKATIVSPITREDILNFFAIDDAPLTKKSAPFIRKKNPKKNNIYVIIIIF